MSANMYNFIVLIVNDVFLLLIQMVNLANL